MPHIFQLSFSVLGGTPYDGLYEEAPPGRGTFFRLQVYERVVGNLSFGSVKGPKGLIRWISVLKSGKRSILEIDSYLKDNAFAAVKKVCERGTICQ